MRPGVCHFCQVSFIDVLASCILPLVSCLRVSAATAATLLLPYQIAHQVSGLQAVPMKTVGLIGNWPAIEQREHSQNVDLVFWGRAKKLTVGKSQSVPFYPDTD